MDMITELIYVGDQTAARGRAGAIVPFRANVFLRPLENQNRQTFYKAIEIPYGLMNRNFNTLSKKAFNRYGVNFQLKPMYFLFYLLVYFQPKPMDQQVLRENEHEACASDI